jgi:hypothetical protein
MPKQLEYARMQECKGRNQMDWSRIIWEKVFEARLWVFINLVLPLCIIPFAA